MFSFLHIATFFARMNSVWWSLFTLNKHCNNMSIISSSNVVNAFFFLSLNSFLRFHLITVIIKNLIDTAFFSSKRINFVFYLHDFLLLNFEPSFTNYYLHKLLTNSLNFYNWFLLLFWKKKAVIFLYFLNRCDVYAESITACCVPSSQTKWNSWRCSIGWRRLMCVYIFFN